MRRRLKWRRDRIPPRIACASSATTGSSPYLRLHSSIICGLNRGAQHDSNFAHRELGVKIANTPLRSPELRRIMTSHQLAIVQVVPLGALPIEVLNRSREAGCVAESKRADIHTEFRQGLSRQSGLGSDQEREDPVRLVVCSPASLMAWPETCRSAASSLECQTSGCGIHKHLRGTGFAQTTMVYALSGNRPT